MCRLLWNETEDNEKVATITPLYAMTVYEADEGWFYKIDGESCGPFKGCEEAKDAAEKKLYTIIKDLYEFLGGTPLEADMKSDVSLMRLRSIELKNMLIWNKLRRVHEPKTDQLDVEIEYILGELVGLRNKEDDLNGVSS